MKKKTGNAGNQCKNGGKEREKTTQCPVMTNPWGSQAGQWRREKKKKTGVRRKVEMTQLKASGRRRKERLVITGHVAD